jgi:hypothetical protein
MALALSSSFPIRSLVPFLEDRVFSGWTAWKEIMSVDRKYIVNNQALTAHRFFRTTKTPKAILFVVQ